MAVDTRNKRFSLIGLAAPMLLVLPLADGSFDTVADRQHLAYMYAGIQAANPVPIPNQTTIFGLVVSAASFALDVECVSPSQAIDVDVRGAASAVNVKVT